MRIHETFKLYQESMSAWPKPGCYNGAHGMYTSYALLFCKKKCITKNILSIHVSRSYSCQFRVQPMSACWYEI